MRITTQLIMLCATLLTMAVLPLSARGQDLPLTVTTQTEGEMLLGAKALAALPQSNITTTTPWTDGTKTFTGVPLSALLASVGATGADIEVVALNDYAATIPAEGISGAAPIVAYLMDGAPMPIREKGPYWIIYPYDAGPEFRTEVIFSRSVWQVAQINIR